jgi:beta-lactamase class A
MTAEAPSHAQQAISEAVDAFTQSAPARSVAIESLRGSRVRVSVAGRAVRPAASLLKLPLVAAVRDAAREGRLDPRLRVAVGELGSTAYPSVLGAFPPGRELELGELCALCLVTSDNPIACRLLDLIGSGAVNEKLRQIGCLDSHLEVSFSDEFLEASGRVNVTTACDALTLARRLIADDPWIGGVLHDNLRNTRIPLRLQPTTGAPHKTGTLPGVANDVGVVYGARTDFAVAFLCDQEADTAQTSIAIGDCVAAVCKALGEPVVEA